VNEQEQRPAQPGALRRSIRVLTAIELTIGAIALLAILVLVFMQAAQRYSPFESFAWTGELARFAMIWLAFSVMGVLITSRGHIALEIVDTFKNQMLVRIIQTIALVIVVAVGAGLTYEAWALVTTQGIIKSPVLRLPMSIVYIPVLIGVVSLTIRAAVAALDVLINGPHLADYDESEATTA
jgi:TRAP-type C4-dicarboxylate transport system permease small subunit